MWGTKNIFLNGPFAPWREDSVAYDLEVVGQIPADLNGAFYQVGASQHFKPENLERYHFFDGDGQVNAIFLRDGRATHRNRYVMTDGLKQEMEAGRALYGGMFNGTGKPMSMDEGLPPFKNPGNTNVRLFNGRLLALCEVDLPHALRLDTLETMGRYDFGGRVSGSVTAHPKIDPDNGDLLFFGHGGGFVTWYRADRNGVLLDTHKVDMGVATFVHDFGLTPNYAIFQANPLVFTPEQALVGNPLLNWDTERMPVSRFAVMHRVTGEVRWFEATEPYVVSHYYNAYEDGDSIVIDAHRTTEPVTLLTAEALKTFGVTEDYNAWFTTMLSTATRFELNLATGGFKERYITDVTGEFPRINDALVGREHRFGYYTTQRTDAEWLFEAVAKCDTKTGRVDVLTVDGLVATDECVFVAREGATAEDDGWLLSIWWDAATDRSEVVIADAQDLSAAPVARIKLNHRVPFQFHGDWAPAADIDAALSRTGS